MRVFNFWMRIMKKLKKNLVSKQNKEVFQTNKSKKEIFQEEI